MLWGKNKLLIEEIDLFIDICGKAIENYINTFHHYFNNGIDGEFNYGADKVKKYEADADTQVAKIKDLLYGNYLLPEAREDIAILINHFDDIVDGAYHSLQYISARKLAPIDDLRQLYQELLSATNDCFSKTAEVARMTFGAHNSDEVKRMVEEVGSFESICDAVAHKIVVKIFEMDLTDCDQVLHSQLVDICSGISDSCEDTAGVINIMNLKRVI